MKITDEMLYAAAPEAAERYLNTLPKQEDCVHGFSRDFEERMRFLPPRRKKRLWKRIVLLAAVIALLGTAVHANQPEDYRVRAAARDGVLTYSARPQEDVVAQQFHRITMGWIPEGYALWSESGLEEDTVYSSTSYRAGDYRYISLRQWMGQEYSETLMGEYQWEEVTVRGSEGIFIDAAGDSLSYTLLWAEGPYVLRLETDGSLDRETFWTIAENLEW